MPTKPVLVSWSSGKDSAWALHVLRQQPERYDVRGIFTTVTPHFNRVAIQATPVPVLRVQAERLGLPLYEIPIPYPCSNEEYEAAMAAFLDMRPWPAARPDRRHPSPLATSTWKTFGRTGRPSSRARGSRPSSRSGACPRQSWRKTMLRSGLKAIVTAVSPTSQARPQLCRALVRSIIPRRSARRHGLARRERRIPHLRRGRAHVQPSHCCATREDRRQAGEPQSRRHRRHGHRVVRGRGIAGRVEHTSSEGRRAGANKPSVATIALRET